MSSLFDLLKIPTRDEVFDTIVGALRRVGFPVASWQPGTVLRHLVEAEALFLASLGEDIAAVARGGLLDYAEDAWLDLLVAAFFDEVRKPAVFTEGLVRFADTGNVGPVQLTSGTYWISRADGSTRFRNVHTPLTLPMGGVVDVPVRAEIAGASYNLACESLVLLNPTIAGVTIANIADPARGTWITTQGLDEETDEALRTRCRAKWAALTGSTEDAYRYWTLSAHPEIARVRVLSTTEGRIDVWFAGPTDAPSAAATAAVENALAANKPLAIKVVGTPARRRTVPVRGTLFVRPGADRKAALAAASSAVDAFARSTLMGDVIYANELIEAVMRPSTVYDCALVWDPLADARGNLTLAPDEIFVPSYVGLVTS